MTSTPYHIPALLAETIELLDIKPDGVYADVTFGGGGHSRAILKRLGSDGQLLAFDRDADAAANIPEGESRLTFVLSDYRHIRNFARFHGIEAFDGILADLGVSFHHFDDSERGFSFRSDAPLDMRMTRTAERDAKEIVNTYSADDLRRMLRSFTDLKNVGNIVNRIVTARQKEPIATTLQLADTVAPAINPRQQKKDLAQIFQALRIETNNEIDSLRKFLLSTTRLLKPGGRLAILTYHSIEDRLVKNFMKTGNLEGEEKKDFFGRVETPWKLITRSPLVPSAEEVENNPRARSAKLRVAELVGPPKK